MATLATIFASPMFAFVEPLENEEDVKLPKTSKNILYFTAILSSFGVFILLNHLTNSKMGMHTMGIANLSSINPLYIVLLLFIGVALSYFYFASNVLVKRTFENMNDNHILKGVIGGLILGISGSLLPLTMFSGEHQIHMLLESGVQIGVLILIATSITKILLTNICIETGLKGGHFFPMIFSGVAMGYAMSIIMNIDPIVSMSVVTTALLANILKKPIAVVLLLMILFPVNMIPLMLLTAVISCLFKTSKTLLLA
jgi:H+/Cl- antiporter ClcA